jgi:hypothetical protein
LCFEQKFAFYNDKRKVAVEDSVKFTGLVVLTETAVLREFGLSKHKEKT